MIIRKSYIKYIYLYLAIYLSSATYGLVYLLYYYITEYLNLSVISYVTFFVASALTMIISVLSTSKLVKLIGCCRVASVGALLNSFGMFLISMFATNIYMIFISAILIGLGWCFIYASCPMILLQKGVSSKYKKQHISLLSAFIVMGTSTFSVINYFLNDSVSLTILYILGSIVGAVAFVLYTLANRYFNYRIVPTQIKIMTLRNIFSNCRTYSFVMVFLGACIITVLLNMQISYAQARDFAYYQFYLGYSCSIVLSRILVSQYIASDRPLKSVPYLLLIMLSGVMMLIFNNNSYILYILSSVLLGLSYGLIYPQIKYNILVITPSLMRHEILSTFTFFYFCGMCLFH